MHWFEATARAVLLAVIVLVGAAIVRNVTDTLTGVAIHTPAPAPERTALR